MELKLVGDLLATHYDMELALRSICISSDPEEQTTVKDSLARGLYRLGKSIAALTSNSDEEERTKTELLCSTWTSIMPTSLSSSTAQDTSSPGPSVV